MVALEMEDIPSLIKVFIHGGKERIGLTQGELVINYLLQEGMSIKGSLLPKAGPSRNLISMESFRL